MVQVLEALPTFGQSLVAQLAQTGSQIGQGLIQKRANRLDQEIINSFNPEDAPLVQIQKFAKLSKSAQEGISPVFNQFLKSQEMQAAGAVKAASAQKKEDQETGGLKDTLDFLDKNVSYTGENLVPGFKSFTAGGLNREAVEKREEIDKSGFLAADAIFTKYNKGVLSKDKLKIVQDMAPNSKDSERVYKAKVNALRRMAQLPANATKEDFDKQLDREVKAVNKAQPKEKERPSLESFYQ